MFPDFKINFFEFKISIQCSNLRNAYAHCILFLYFTISKKSYKIAGNEYHEHEFNLIHVKTINYAQTCGSQNNKIA